MGSVSNRLDRRHVDRQRHPRPDACSRLGAMRYNAARGRRVAGDRDWKRPLRSPAAPTGSRAACGGESDCRGSSTHHRNRNRAAQHEARSRRHPHQSSRRRRVALAHARHDGVAERAARLAGDHRSSGRVDCAIELAFVHHSCPSRAFNRSRASRTRPRNVAPGNVQRGRDFVLRQITRCRQQQRIAQFRRQPANLLLHVPDEFCRLHALFVRRSDGAQRRQLGVR